MRKRISGPAPHSPGPRRQAVPRRQGRLGAYLQGQGSSGLWLRGQPGFCGARGLYQFTQDYTFSAPSTTAAVVLGRSANGRVEWKAADGRTLKEIQEAEAGQ